uniref:Protein FAM134C n=2 Tax=Mesocestoides corti TaxID=53468 RepID=A0A5K3FNL4_MESCO
MVHTDLTQERFYNDAYAVLSNWEGILLRIEYLLLYKKFFPSFAFFLIVQVTFWVPVFLQLNKAFVVATCLSLAALLDLGKNWVLPMAEDFIHRSTGFDPSREVKAAADMKEIYNLEELSYYAAKGFRLSVSLMNVFAPYRNRHPTVFLLLSCTVSLIIIWLGTIAEDYQLTYILLNVTLIVPGLLYHRIFSRIWDHIRPYIARIEEEFDRGQLESAAEREAGEKELWEPIASSPFFRNEDEKFENSKPSSGNFDVDYDDLDTSESQFIQSFIPHRLQQSTEKNKRALDSMTREILQTCKTQEDIDEWFLEVTQDPKQIDEPNRTGRTRRTTLETDIGSPSISNGGTGDPTFNSDFDSAAWEEFSTDEELEPSEFADDSYVKTER